MKHKSTRPLKNRYYCVTASFSAPHFTNGASKVCCTVVEAVKFCKNTLQLIVYLDNSSAQNKVNVMGNSFMYSLEITSLQCANLDLLY